MGLVGTFDKNVFYGVFHGISTIVGYLMPNPLYTCRSDIYDFETHFVDNVFKRAYARSLAHR